MTLAGNIANLILFLVFTRMFAVVGLVAERVRSLTASLEILQRMMFYGMRLNLVLAFFNLIPIPPLDGSHVFYHLLPPGWGLKRSEEHTSELQSQFHLVCRLLLEKKKKKYK